MRLDGIEQGLLGLLQSGFPLSGEPYAELGRGLGVPEDEVIRRIRQMKTSGLVRQISPVMDARRLGYKTTLAAMRVAEAKLERAAGILAGHQSVSHAYERDHHFNLWFTLAVPGAVDTNAELLRLADIMEAESAFDLPAVKMFKLRTYFGKDGGDHTKVPAGAQDSTVQWEVQLSSADRKVINELQQDLPLVPRPFAEMSARLGMDEDGFLAQCRSLLSRKIIRRFGASVNHREAGFAANAMTCWAVPADMAELMAEKLVPLRQVSHCYERKTNSQWHYNVFAMIHASTRELCRETADKVSAETGFADYVTLFSTREFKKTRVIYRV